MKALHNEHTIHALVANGGGIIDGANRGTYTMPDGIMRHWALVSQTRCGIDGVMHHYAVSRQPITRADEDAVMRDWNRGA